MASLWSGERGVVLVTCLGAYFLSMAMIYQNIGTVIASLLLLVTSASLVVTSALLVVQKAIRIKLN